MKINASLKIVAFIASVISLSWSFAGYRAVQQAPTVSSCCMLLFAVLSTVLLLGLQGYWIYIEEMKKSTLKRKIALFDRIHSWIGKAREKHS
jgi:hypothetical protein